MRRHLGAFGLLLLLAVSAVAAETGQCSNPDTKAAAGGPARPCGGGSGAAATEKEAKVTAVAPKELDAALADARGVALLLLHKGDK